MTDLVMNENKMIDGQTVEVKLAADPKWYKGTVIKARKQWVELNDYPFSEKYIADENSIEEWRII